MAYVASGSTYHSNAIPGWLQGIDESSIYDVDSRGKFAVGSGFKRADGAIFRYGNFITATAPGKLVSPVVADTMEPYTTSLVILGVAATQQANDPIGVYPSYIGSRYVEITLASVVADQYAGGYIAISLGTGLPYTYRIKRNTASATVNSQSSAVFIELYEPLVATLAASTSTTITIIGSLYNDLYLNTAGGTAGTTGNITVGVSCANMTANTYGWVQTHGVTACIADGTLTTGCLLSASAKVAGAVQQYGVGTTHNSGNGLFIYNAVGFCIDPAASASYAMIYLQLE
jgi:hypothetical protein